MRNRSSSPLIMLGPFLLTLLGGAFCIWSASGNALNLCVTTGCQLFQELSIKGVSLWWFGAMAFAVLTLLSVSGRPLLGIFMAGFFLFIDILLLLLMIFTAPCVGCLFVAVLFASCFMAFRGYGVKQGVKSRSWLLMVWCVLFLMNIGIIARMEVGPWALHGSEKATVRVYFSPSCSACKEAIHTLSGRTHVAFYPIAENAHDVVVIADIIALLQKGQSMAEAMNASKSDAPRGYWARYNPEILLLHFRLLRNKARILAAGSHTVPFIEYQGLPAGLSQRPAGSSGAATTLPKDAVLPLDGEIAGSCGGGASAPCP